MNTNSHKRNNNVSRGKEVEVRLKAIRELLEELCFYLFLFPRTFETSSGFSTPDLIVSLNLLQ